MLAVGDGLTGSMSRATDQKYLSERGILFLLILGVLVPVALVSAAGIVALVVGRGTESIVIGILVITFALGSLGAAIAILVMFRKRTRLARQQMTFVTNVTHELRTPLASIRLFAQTLQMERLQDDAQRKECVEAILRESDRLTLLVDRVLQWRRISEGKRIYEQRIETVEPALREALDAFRGTLRSGEATMAVDLRSAQLVHVDRAALAEAVLNLLVNAHKYTGERKEIALSSRDADGGVEVAVRDNGVGIPEAEQERIFEPFRRVDERLRSHASGVGLGLAIVRDVVTAHGGRVRVDSEPGKGSTFTLFLPRVADGAQGGAAG
jgi:two-component system phosphate regulon sensor histidine kinase PhoR